MRNQNQVRVSIQRDGQIKVQTDGATKEVIDRAIETFKRTLKANPDIRGIIVGGNYIDVDY